MAQWNLQRTAEELKNSKFNYYMATKNLIVHTLWIIQMYEIPRAKPPIQNCLGYLFRERVTTVSYILTK